MHFCSDCTRRETIKAAIKCKGSASGEHERTELARSGRVLISSLCKIYDPLDILSAFLECLSGVPFRAMEYR